MTYEEMATKWENGNLTEVLRAISNLPTPAEGFLSCYALQGMLSSRQFESLLRLVQEI